MLNFAPLYWVYHDNWKFTETILVPDREGNLVPKVTNYDHAGHVHFFMMDYNTLEHATQQAYTGSQIYSFEVEDVWGPNSTDPNQIRSYKLIGKPRWYFYIEEYWRRVYVQPWDVENYVEQYPNHPNRIGLKYDASKPEHSFGPFREGGGLYFFDTEVNRTLPVEYWLNEEKTKRQHVLKKQHYSWDETKGDQVWNFETEKRAWSRRGRYYYSGWHGDNVRYDENGYEDGVNHQGDIVRVGATTDNRKKYYKYTFIASTPVVSYGERYYPNPTPGASISTLETEYLRYFDFWSTYGDQYTNEYSKWKSDNQRQGTHDDFLEFISYKQEEFQENCLESDRLTLRFEYIGFEDYCLVWEELDREQVIALGVFGDYPLLRENVTLPTSKTEFGDENDPYHKNNTEVNPYEVYKKYFDRREEYTIPRGSTAKGDLASGTHPRETSFSDEDGARRFYSDNLYISPVIEYQKVVHLNNERLPERVSAESNIDIWTDTSGNFGDGFKVEISIPFRINGIIQSPFSDDSGNVYPPGNYFHGMKDANKMKYALESYGDPLEIGTKEKEVDAALEKVKKYRFSEYQRFIQTMPDTDAKVNWFNQNYANRPITFNEEEGQFDANGNWIEVVTNDRPNDSQVNFDENGKPTMNPKVVKFNNPGYKEDGIWVEQCLGAIVKPKVEFVFEDALGHRFTRWVDAMEAKSSQPFEGKPE